MRFSVAILAALAASVAATVPHAEVQDGVKPGTMEPRSNNGVQLLGRQSCPSGWGICPNNTNLCCPLGGECCDGGGCCDPGWQCWISHLGALGCCPIGEICS